MIYISGGGDITKRDVSGMRGNTGEGMNKSNNYCTLGHNAIPDYLKSGQIEKGIGTDQSGYVACQ